MQPIEKSVHVPLSPARAFDLFTAGIDRWWPGETHSLSADHGGPQKIWTETRLGGRILELKHDGTTRPWATITDWRPGAAFALDWYVGRSPDQATKLTVTFTAEGSGTRVDLRHWGFEVLGKQGEAIGASYRGGWERVLGHNYAEAARADAG